MDLRPFPNALKNGGTVYVAPHAVDYVGARCEPDGIVSDQPYRLIYVQSGAAAVVVDGPEVDTRLSQMVKR